METYFAMARGTRDTGSHESCNGHERITQGQPALEMTKWFDTNYHYMVPEFSRGQRFDLVSIKPVDDFLEARSLGIHTRPVLIGPVTYLRLGKCQDGETDPLSLLPDLTAVYAEILRRLEQAGADWVQIDEPCLVLDLDERTRRALKQVYAMLGEAAPGIKLLLTTYFGGLGDNLDTVLGLPVAGLHLDLARAPDQLTCIAAKAPADLVLSLGVVRTVGTSGAAICPPSSIGSSPSSTSGDQAR